MTKLFSEFCDFIYSAFFPSITSRSESSVNIYFYIKKLVAYTEEEVDFTAAYISSVNTYFYIKKLVAYTEEEVDFTAPG